MIEALYERVFSTTLNSGLQVLVEEVPTSRSVSVGIWVKVGSRDDPDSLFGLTHFLEHLLFKGTFTRDARRIAQEIDGVGGHLNAATGKESTFYYAEVPVDGLPLALEILADLVQHPALDPEELERERGVILEEIKSHKDDPEQHAYDLFNAGLWEGSHPLSRSVLGDRSTIKEVTREEVAGYHRRFYQPGNMVLVVCGAIDVKRAITLVEQLFDPFSVSSGVSRRSPPSMRSGRALHERETEQSHLYLGLPGTNASDDDRFALEVANTVLGDGMSSRLFRIIREERGLAYAITSSLTLYSDAGSWVVYAGVAPENVAEVVKITLTELNRLRGEGISPDELSLAKAKLQGHLILNLETNANRMARLGSAAVIGREILSPDELIGRVGAVSLEDIARVLARFARPDALNLAVVGPRTADVEKLCELG